METYEKEIYNFLTQRENYKQMLKVLEHQDLIWENLIIEFWDLVAKKLEQLNEAKVKQWKVIKDEDYFFKESAITLIKEDWQPKTT
ncbi:MAG: hypothetical protein H6558_19580 [Lewinellaceae bacterium]|nr:hypothetical protein [Lewinellaceae bacterium]